MMNRPFPWGRAIALLLLVPCGLLPLLLAKQPSSPIAASRSRFHDWTNRFVVYPHAGTLGALRAVESDPRAMFRWREVEQNSAFAQRRQFQAAPDLGFDKEGPLAQFRQRRAPGGKPIGKPIRHQRSVDRDWNISLGGGSTAAGQFPAKFTFDVTAAPSCANDFVVFPVNVNGGAAQPNIVAFNNLYSGTAGGNGICNRAVTGNDVGTAATVLWSYNVHALGAGAVPTSPVLSNDATGSKVAFVESATGSVAHFHVLAWKSGDGKVANQQSVTTPKAIAAFSGTAPAAGSGTATDLVLGTASDTISSPFVDYVRDLAYVGSDDGTLYRIKNVFCALPSCANAAPSLDTTWGTAGAVTVGSGSCAGTAKARLTGPILDFGTLNVFVGCADGKVYGFTSTGSAMATPSITVGNGSANGGIVESPIVDGVNGFLYAVSGTGSSGANAVLVQATTSLSGPCAGALCVATVGNANVHPAHAPAFNDNYFSNATSSTWFLYMGGFTGAASGTLTLYGAKFNAARVMTAGTPANTFSLGTAPGEYSPLTEFKNGNTDWLFVSVFVATPADLGLLNINNFPLAFTRTVQVGTGLSGMIVDNVSASAQASSIYFGLPNNNAAVKLTQSGLQ